MSHPFRLVNFIKVPGKFDPNSDGFAPRFRCRFRIEEPIKEAILSVCGLGIGYFYLNGREVSEDRLAAPCSDYRKTLWFTRYDCSGLLRTGDNVAAVQCGNGWYNESLLSSWDYDVAPWRDSPKFILTLEVNGKRVLCSDEHWKCTNESAVLYNQLRSGETFDARLEQPAWTGLSFDDNQWTFACSDATPPTGVFRLTPCQPIREDRVFPAISVTDRGEGRYIFDMGQNMSGYIRLTVDDRQQSGDILNIRYAEKLDAAGDPDYFDMERYYPRSSFAHDCFICNGQNFTWSPRFAYHGFRYIEVTGLREPDLSTVSGVFVHQASSVRSSFTCSDEYLNRLFHAGQMATLSNLFWMPTDCPTREKLGWCNDAQASCEQMLTDFETEGLFEKWLQDLFDAQRPDGAMPGIVPTSGWGFHWGNGPVSDGVLFEVPYRLYLHTGKPDFLIRALPYFDRYLAYLETKKDASGTISFGLDDWAPPCWEDMVRAPFINAVYLVKFLRIAGIAAETAGLDASPYSAALKKQEAYVKQTYLREDGTCRIEKQTCVAMLLYHGVYDELTPLKEQLARLVEEKNFHHDCGMVGLRHLYMALNKCGLEDYAYRILTAEGYPSYRQWDLDGMTTLYEKWDREESHNHHMYSDFMSWMIKTILGIRLEAPGYTKVCLDPYFFEELSFARGHVDTKHGRLSVEWSRSTEGVSLCVSVPDGIEASCRGRRLPCGKTVLHF